MSMHPVSQPPSRRRAALPAIFAAALLAVSGVALAVTPSSGRYSGKSAQGKSISFSVSGGKVRHLKVGYKASCPGGSATATASFSAAIRISAGRFTIAAANGTVKGRFTTTTKASGTLRFQPSIYGMYGPQHCDSGTVRWSARRG